MGGFFSPVVSPAHTESSRVFPLWCSFCKHLKLSKFSAGEFLIAQMCSCLPSWGHPGTSQDFVFSHSPSSPLIHAEHKYSCHSSKGSPRGSRSAGLGRSLGGESQPLRACCGFLESRLPCQGDAEMKPSPWCGQEHEA